jgi:hypothetical protein
MDRIRTAVTLVRQPAAVIRGRWLSRTALLLACALPACGQGHAETVGAARADSIASARLDSINRAQPGYIVDSILPVDEQLRRFRASAPDTARSLRDGATSADGLVRSFVQRIEASDTVGLARLTISRAEFAWLVYPESPFSRRPYLQSPDLVWMRHLAASGTGLQRLLSRLGGRPLGFRSWSCDPQPTVEGANRIWRGCLVRFSQAPDSSGLQLFSSIVERDGRFKILSYGNAF